MRLKVDGFKDLMKNWWEGYNIQGSFSHILAVKFRGLKLELGVSNREVFGNVSTKELVAFSQLWLWDAKEMEEPLFVEER